MAPQKLRDLIKSIRATKTAAEEREVVQKESAAIRDYFRTEDTDYRARSVSKVLYMFMLGYPAHFAQLECLKLIAVGKFPDKRMGYLGAMLLLDELKDVSLLITNSLKNDLVSPNQYIAGLALSTVGTICSSEMARDLVTEIEKLLKSTNTYLRKKALLCALRMIRKEPELIETFIPATRSLLSERSHAVLVTGINLIIEMTQHDPETLTHFRRLVPSLVLMLKNLVMGFSQEHDVGGVTDPFLQTTILRLLRVLGKGDQEASDAMSDILAQVATNTESSKNVGNAILYEAVLCIMNIQSESGLRVLAINLLGRFLVNHDRNIRYVALNTLLRTVQTSDSSEAVQRHRTVIIDCLKEADISIRRRALELAFALVNESNVQSLVGELMDVLPAAEPEVKSFMTTELILAGEKYADDRRWHVDTTLKILDMAGEYVRDDSVASIVSLYADSSSYQPYIVKRLFQSLNESINQQALCQVACWAVGEFGDLLINANVEEVPVTPSEHEVLDLLQSVLIATTTTPVTRQYAFTAIMKLSTRFANSTDRIRTIISIYATTHDTELQQRSNEYTTIFEGFNHLRPALLERMPVADRSAIAAAQAAQAAARKSKGHSAPAAVVNTVAPAAAAPAPVANTGALLDLLGDSTPTAAVPAGSGDVLDLLGLNLGGPSSSSSSSKPAAAGSLNLLDLLGGPALAQTSQSAALGLDSLLGGFGSKPAANNAFDSFGFDSGSGIPSITAINTQGLNVQFSFTKSLGSTSLEVKLTASNSTATPLQNFVFQAAVPKSFQIMLQPPSSNIVPPFNTGNVTQNFTIVNNDRQPIRLRVRITFVANGQPVTIQEEVSNFPAAAL